jgi:hypothetical protein
MPFSPSLRLAAALAITLCTAPAALGQTTALTFTGGVSLGAGPQIGQNGGWRFTTSAPIVVTALGLFDEEGDGLALSHPIGIFNTATGAALITATVSSADPLDASGFRFDTALTGNPLLPAGDYVIGAFFIANNTDRVRGVVPPTDVTTAPGITYVQNRFNNSPTFGMPDLTASSQERGYFGPNFQFAAVPEPATVGLISLAVGGGLVAWRRRRAAEPADDE